MKAELFYITDTYCIWCYGFGQAISQLARDYADRINVRVLNGGMIPSDITLSAMFGRFADPMALHERVTSMSGQVFGKPYLDEIRQFSSSKRILNSNMPARALLALKQLGAEDELAITSAIQHAYYTEGHDLQDISTYAPIAARFGLGFENFKSKMDGPDPAMGLILERRMIEQFGIQGFPAVLLRGSDGRFVMIGRGFLPFADLKKNLDEALSRHWSASSPVLEGQVCHLDGSGC